MKELNDNELDAVTGGSNPNYGSGRELDYTQLYIGLRIHVLKASGSMVQIITTGKVSSVKKESIYNGEAWFVYVQKEDSGLLGRYAADEYRFETA